MTKKENKALDKACELLGNATDDLCASHNCELDDKDQKLSKKDIRKALKKIELAHDKLTGLIDN